VLIQYEVDNHNSNHQNATAFHSFLVMYCLAS